MTDKLTVSVVNHTDQKFPNVDIEKICKAVCAREGMDLKELSVALIAPEQMADANHRYHGEEGTTDVLSFDYEDGTGEILIDPQRIVEQSQQFDHDPPDELREVLIHGLLHLAGYDHLADDGEHLSRQKKYLEEITNL